MANKSYAAENLIDNDYTTVWVEGASGDGIGETITIHLSKEQSPKEALANTI